MSVDAILRVQVTAVSAKGGAGRSVDGFTRYVQHRDAHADQLEKEHGPDGREPVRDVDSFVRYVAHRDAAESHGRLFDAGGEIGSAERKELTRYIDRSTDGARSNFQQGRDGVWRDQAVAAYRFVLSPEHAQGLDLRALTRATMAELDRQVGGRGGTGAGPWLAAEHQNTAHPHVHIVLAARREVEPGVFRQVRVTGGRLEAMKEAMTLEITRQRGDRMQGMERTEQALARLAEPRAAAHQHGRTPELTVGAVDGRGPDPVGHALARTPQPEHAPAPATPQRQAGQDMGGGMVAVGLGAALAALFQAGIQASREIEARQAQRDRERERERENDGWER